MAIRELKSKRDGRWHLIAKCIDLPCGWCVGVSVPMSYVDDWRCLDKWLYVASHEYHDERGNLVKRSWQIRLLWFYVGRQVKFDTETRNANSR